MALMDFRREHEGQRDEPDQVKFHIGQWLLRGFHLKSRGVRVFTPELNYYFFQSAGAPLFFSICQSSFIYF